jgi:hypothetical protein
VAEAAELTDNLVDKDLVVLQVEVAETHHTLQEVAVEELEELENMLDA